MFDMFAIFEGYSPAVADTVQAFDAKENFLLNMTFSYGIEKILFFVRMTNFAIRPKRIFIGTYFYVNQL